MQNFASTDISAMSLGGTIALNDSRDDQEYLVTKMFFNKVWMTKNLAIGCNGSGSTYGNAISSKSLTSSDSNIASNWPTPTAVFDADNNSATTGYTTPAMQCDATYGAWYNFAAATAGTITGSDNNANATYDICPKGWKLPGYSEVSLSQSFFNPVTGGRYMNGSPNSPKFGYWWSADHGNSSGKRYAYYFYDGSLTNDGSFAPYYGHYIRCIKS